MKKTSTPPSAGPQLLGTSVEALKHDVAALLSPLQEVWGGIRKEIGSGEKVKAAVHQSGLDETWNALKQAAASVVQPLLAPATKMAERPKTAKKAASKTAKKVAGKVSAVKKKVAKKAK